jgi:hypothetical protein
MDGARPPNGSPRSFSNVAIAGIEKILCAPRPHNARAPLAGLLSSNGNCSASEQATGIPYKKKARPCGEGEIMEQPTTEGPVLGQALAALPEEIRRAVREEMRRDLADTGGPIKAEAEYRIASGRR